jgi:hypothetical protein
MTIAHKIITITFHALYNDADHTGDELEIAFESGLIEVASEIPCVLIGEVESRGELQEFPTITGFEDMKKLGPMRGRST